MPMKKVLVIDDERIVLDSVRKILAEEKFEVDTTLKGREGIQQALKNPYDLILTDVRMPDISGKVVLREVKRAKPSLPIVVVTGYATVQSAIETVKLGATDYLEKPFTPEELLRVVHAALSTPEVRSPEDSGPAAEKDSLRALVIDDERIVLDSVSRILKAARFKVDVSQSAREGLKRAVEKPYDIVLTDLRMPDIGGMRVLRDIKRTKPSLPVVMITGFGHVRTAVQAMKLGAAEYIQKPFSPDELTAAVQSALRLASSQAPEDQGIIHKEEVLRVLERIGSDPLLVNHLLSYGADALDDFNLTGPEKLAILTGDIQWIEQHAGPLSTAQRKWLDQRLSAEIW